MTFNNLRTADDISEILSLETFMLMAGHLANGHFTEKVQVKNSKKQYCKYFN